MMFSKLQYISQGETGTDQIANIRDTLDAGCKWVQLRFKSAGESELAATAEQVKKLCDSYKATFIINDHVQLAQTIDASGVHLGLSDMPVTEARQMLGTDKIIGGTANTLEDVLSRVEEKCDYIGLGPFRFTHTKKNLSPILSLAGFEKIMTAIDLKSIHTPVYAIGGILSEDVESIMRTGVYGVAVAGEITTSDNKEAILQKFKALLSGKINHS